MTTCTTTLTFDEPVFASLLLHRNNWCLSWRHCDHFRRHTSGHTVSLSHTSQSSHYTHTNYTLATMVVCCATTTSTTSTCKLIGLNHGCQVGKKWGFLFVFRTMLSVLDSTGLIKLMPRVGNYHICPNLVYVLPVCKLRGWHGMYVSPGGCPCHGYQVWIQSGSDWPQNATNPSFFQIKFQFILTQWAGTIF